jgi:hypothetical protein
MRQMMLAFSALAVAGGCNPNDFGAALDKAPVQFIGAPDAFGPNAGLTLLPLTPPANTMAARLLFAGTDSPSLAVADFDGDGKPEIQAASSVELGKLGVIGQGGISSAAWLAGPTAAGTILLGMPNFSSVAGKYPAGRVAFATLGANASGKVTFDIAQVASDGPANDYHYGRVVASGQVTQTGADEAVVLSDEGVRVLGIPAGAAVATTCTSFLPTPDIPRWSLAVADFLIGGNQEIAVGLPVEGGAGRVVIVQYGPNPANPTGPAELFCAGLPIGAPNTASNSAVAGFGTSLVAVPDMNGDGRAELVVGAPPDGAYLLFSPFDSTALTKMFTNNDPTYQFGQRVALVDIDGDGTKELAITAVQIGTKKAEQVLVYKLDGDGMNPIAIINDGSLTASTELGLADLEFDARACKGQDAHLLVVSADAGIFTYFRFAGSSSTTPLARDPRCFVQK